MLLYFTLKVENKSWRC